MLEGGTMRRLLTISLLAILGLGACSGGGAKPLAPTPTKPIEASRFFTGRWYEIARTPMKLTDGCVAGTTDYFRNSDGTLMDRDACRMGSAAGKEKVFQGPVSILTPANNEVTVHYVVYGFFPVGKTYWMLDRGDDYSWFIVTDPAFDMLSLFTRNPRPRQDEVEALTARAQALGYDTAKLEYPARFPPGQH